MPSRQAWPQPGTSHLGPRPHGPRERHHPTRIHHLPCPQLASPPCSQPVQVPAPSLRPRCTRSDQKPLTWVVSGRASQHGCRHGATPRRARAGPEGLQPTCSCTGLGGARWAPIARHYTAPSHAAKALPLPGSPPGRAHTPGQGQRGRRLACNSLARKALRRAGTTATPEGKAVGLPPQQQGAKQCRTHGPTEPPPAAPRLLGQRGV